MVIKNICHNLQAQIDAEIDRLLKGRKCDVVGYVTDTNRGQAKRGGEIFTVPLWAYDKDRKSTRLNSSH